MAFWKCKPLFGWEDVADLFGLRGVLSVLCREFCPLLTFWSPSGEGTWKVGWAGGVSCCEVWQLVGGLVWLLLWDWELPEVVVLGWRIGWGVKIVTSVSVRLLQEVANRAAAWAFLASKICFCLSWSCSFFFLFSSLSFAFFSFSCALSACFVFFLFCPSVLSSGSFLFCWALESPFALPVFFFAFSKCTRSFMSSFLSAAKVKIKLY